METKNVGFSDSKIVETIKNTQDSEDKIAITTEVLTERFGNLKQQITKFDNISMKIDVKNQESLTIAETHVSTINTHLSNIEKVRKIFKEPYLEAGRKIDKYANRLKDDFGMSKKRLNVAITTYKTIAQAKARAEEEKKRKEAEKKHAEKNEEIERLLRIRHQVMARIYGGQYRIKTGDVKTAIGCMTLKDCEDLMTFLKEKFPKPATFKYIADDTLELYNKSVKLLSDHTVNINESESEDPKKRNNAIERIQMARVKENMMSESTLDELTAKAAKAHKREVKTIEKDTLAAGKGLRAKINFNIIDEDEVPIDMKSVDEQNVRAYLNKNMARIKEMLQKGEQPIKGINVFITKDYVSR